MFKEFPLVLDVLKLLHPTCESVSACNIHERKAFVFFPVRKTPAIQWALPRLLSWHSVRFFHSNSSLKAISCKASYRGCQLIYWAIYQCILYWYLSNRKKLCRTRAEVPCLAELYLLQLLLRVERKRRVWKAAGRAPVDALKSDGWSYFPASSPMMETSNSLQKLPVLSLVSWRGAQPLARASQTGCLFQTALLQCEHKPDGGQDIQIIPEPKYLHFCPVYTSEGSILYQMTFGQVFIRWHGIKRVPL